MLREITNCLQSFYDNDNEGLIEKYRNNANYEVREDSYREYKHGNGEVYQITFMAWNLREVNKLARSGNRYAQDFLNERTQNENTNSNT